LICGKRARNILKWLAVVQVMEHGRVTTLVINRFIFGLEDVRNVLAFASDAAYDGLRISRMSLVFICGT
jgi:hypothetical protein